MFYRYYLWFVTDSNTNTINGQPLSPISGVFMIHLFLWKFICSVGIWCFIVLINKKIFQFFSLGIYIGFICLICWHANSPGCIQFFRRSCEINRPSEMKLLFIFFLLTDPLMLFEMAIYFILLLMVVLCIWLVYCIEFYASK